MLRQKKLSVLLVQIDTQLYLIGPDKSEIYLIGGPQTIGRGNGNCMSKRISHKQLSIAANTHDGTAMLRGFTLKICLVLQFLVVRGSP